MRHVGVEKEKVYEKCGHRNTRGGRDQTKPKINVLHLLGQFAPSVGCRTVYTPVREVDLFHGHSRGDLSLSLPIPEE